MYEMLDHTFADSLGVSIDEFILKIESFPLDKATEIIGLLWEDTEESIAKAKILFLS